MTNEQRRRLNELRIANAERNNYELLKADETPIRALPARRTTSKLTDAQRARLDELRANQAQRVAKGTHPMTAATERLTILGNNCHGMGPVGIIEEMTRIVNDTARQLHEDAHQHHADIAHQNHMNFIMQSC